MFLIKCCLPSAIHDPPGLMALQSSYVTGKSHSPSIIASAFLFSFHPVFQLGHYPFQRLKSIFFFNKRCKITIGCFMRVIAKKKNTVTGQYNVICAISCIYVKRNIFQLLFLPLSLFSSGLSFSQQKRSISNKLFFSF